MKLLFRYLLKQKWTVMLALLLSVVNQGAAYLDPLITGKIVDQFIEHRETISRSEFIGGVFLLVGLALIAVTVARLANNYQDYFTNVVVQKTGAEMYSDGLRHSLSLPYFEFEDQSSGKTLGILQKVRKDTENFIKLFVNVFFTALVGLVFVLVYSFSVSYKVTLIYFISVPLIIATSLWLTRKVKKMQEDIMDKTSTLAGSTTESLRNIELVKSLGLADQQVDHLNDNTYQIMDLELVKSRLIRKTGFIQGTMVNVVRSAMMLVLLFLIYNKELSPGQFFTFLLYSLFLFNPLLEIGNVIQAWREAQVSLEQLEGITSKPLEKKPESPTEMEKINKLTYENVGFEYNGSSKGSVKNISLEVASGETIAFVGPSGSGKSTLIKLLAGLYVPTEGKIMYNSINLSELELDNLRRKIGMVTQETQLFSGTIRDNLLFVNPGSDDEHCYEVLKQASCDSLLDRASDKLETYIGEGGLKVSGGEKQRLSIARALLRQPEILIFDEATSALDSITEEEITKTICHISDTTDLITILVAHRLSTIKHAKCIYVLENGGIIESGTHDELLALKGLYYAMWRQQTNK